MWVVKFGDVNFIFIVVGMFFNDEVWIKEEGLWGREKYFEIIFVDIVKILL